MSAVDLAGYATLRPRFEILEVLASIARYQDSMFNAGKSAKGVRWGRVNAWTIVRQAEILAAYERLLKRFGRAPEAATMSRRTLNYQLAGLERDRYIKREQRHQSQRTSRKLALRPSIIKFTTLGRLWISRHVRGVANPIESLAVQRTAQSWVNTELKSSTSLSSAVDKTPTAPSAPRHGKTAAARRRVSSSTNRAVPKPRKARSEGESRSATIGRTAKPRRRRA